MWVPDGPHMGMLPEAYRCQMPNDSINQVNQFEEPAMIYLLTNLVYPPISHVLGLFQVDEPSLSVDKQVYRYVSH